MKKYLENNKGLTLVEILASLVILSIVLFACMSFFTQSAKFTQHNSSTLTEVQIAEAIVAKVRAGNIDIEEYEYEGFKTTLLIKEGPESTNLKKAVISIKSLSTQNLDTKDYTTEMYFEEGSS